MGMQNFRIKVHVIKGNMFWWGTYLQIEERLHYVQLGGGQVVLNKSEHLCFMGLFRVTM